MRSLLVGVAGAVVAVVAAGGLAYAGGVLDDSDLRPGPAAETVTLEPEPVSQQDFGVYETPPFSDVVVEDTHSAGAEWGMGVASSILSVFYTPVRLAVGIVGAALGGVEGWLTGGDIRTARSMWRPTVEGDYYIRPDHLDGTEPYEFGDVRPIAHERITLQGREPVVLEEREEAVDVEPADSSSEVIEPGLDDGSDEDR